jgi:Na+-transporting NADH:ubiquinone oxidoreductase subunit B
MTTGWIEPGNFGVDAVTAATPLALLRSGEQLSNLDLFFGIRAGSFGESSILLIIFAAIYLIWTKTASWRIILSTFLSAATLTGVLYWAGIDKALPPVQAIMSGSLIFVTVFMATDPVSAPKKASSQWFYGIIIGITTILVRTFSLFPEGTSFGVLMGNTFASLLDQIKLKKKVKS